MKELFGKGISFRSYIFNLDDKCKHNMMRYYIPMNIREDISEEVKKINKNINILAVVEPESPDCHINLSVLEKMVSTNSSINISITTRKFVNDELNDYKTDGFLRVPIFIFMDEGFNVKDSFIEKPEVLKKADINTSNGLKINMDYMIGKLTDEISEELLNKLLKIQ